MARYLRVLCIEFDHICDFWWSMGWLVFRTKVSRRESSTTDRFGCYLLKLFIQKNLVKFFTFSSILYGFFISLSGVLTTNVLPPSVEAVGLNMSDYYSLSFQYLSNGKISSYLFGEYLHKYMNGYVFYSLISTLFITCLISLLLINNYLAKHEDKFF